MLKILDVGSGAVSNAAEILSIPEGIEYEITTLDANAEDSPSYTHDVREPFPEELQDAFDLVVCSHVLEHIDRVDVVRTVQNISTTLKNMAELWVLVPSMEWAASEIIAGRHSRSVEAHIFGSQTNEYQYHKCSFTLNALRTLFDHTGLLVKKAYQSPYAIRYTDRDGEVVEDLCIQNVVIGARYDGFEGVV